MALRALELLLNLRVAGTPEAQALEKAIEEIKRAFKDLEGLRTLDKLLNANKAASEVENVFQAISRMRRELAQFGQLKAVDFDPTISGLTRAAQKAREFTDLIVKAGRTRVDLDLSRAHGQLDLTVQKGRTVVDMLAQVGRTPVMVDFSKLRSEIDLAVAKGRQMIDVFAQAGRTRVDFNLSKIVSEAEKAQMAGYRLSQQLQRTRKDTNDLEVAHNRHRSALGQIASNYLFLRRAILGVGLTAFGAQVLEVAKSFDRARQAINTVFGELRGETEFEFVRQQAERLGIQVTELATQYAKFSAAAKALGLDQQIVRDNFLAVAEAGAKLSLSSDQIAGALTAIQQIASKGRLSMEELRQQLGDRLPGAISIAAKGLGVTEARLFALVEAGAVSSDMFLKTFPAALRASFGTDSNTRIENTTATIQRFKNALAEMTDAALRAGLLDAFLVTVKELTRALSDPAVIKFFKDFANGLATATNFVREHIESIKTLLAVYVGFKVFQGVVAVVGTVAAAFQKLTSALGPAAPAVAATSASVRGLAATAQEGTPKVFNLVTALGQLALITKNPIVITVAGLAALDAALLEALIAKMEKAQQVSLALADAQRQIGAQGRVVQLLQEQIKGLEQYRETVMLTLEELDTLDYLNLKYYKEAAEGASRLATTEVNAFQARINQIKALIEVQQASNDTSVQAQNRMAALQSQLADLERQQEGATNSAKRWQAVLKDVATTFNTVQGATKALKLTDLTKDAQGIVQAFGDIAKKGKDVEEALRKAIPDNFADGGIRQIQAVGDAMAFLQKTGQATADVINKVLAKALDNLTGDQLSRFQVQAERAFGTSAKNAQQLSTILNASLSAALKNMGLDAETAGQKISRQFNQLVQSFTAVANNAKATGAQIKGALDVAIQSARTTEELKLLRDTVAGVGLNASQARVEFERLRDSGTASARQLEEAFRKVVLSEALTDSLLRLDDAIRLSAANIDSALGDSFRRLGVQGKTELGALAAQAKVDFDRILASGQATALGIEEAFRAMAEKVIALNNGIPPFEILVKAVDFNAFDLIVKAAETARDRTRKAIEDAIPLADTQAKLEALATSIEVAFDRGKISVDEFGKLITQVGFKLREEMAKPVGELAASAELLGVKTKEQLQALAENAEQAFNTIHASGQFTTGELVKAAQQYVDAYMAANDGVVDSFDPVLQKALEVVNSVNQVTKAVDQMKNKAMEPIGTGNLRDLQGGELKQLLDETARSYRAIGVHNVEQLQIIQEIQKEMNRRGQENADRMKNAADSIDQSTARRLEAESTPPPAPKGGQIDRGDRQPYLGSLNFNFAGSNLNADEIRRKVVPILNDISTRRR